LGCDALATEAFLLPLNSGGTMNELHWDDPEDIGIELYEKFPDTDPLTIRFTELHRMVVELKGFADDASASNEAKLEAIQMAWYEERKDNLE
jgi:FeS assembly protein IscX